MTKKCRKTNASIGRRIVQERGISLISLTVTIVVLAILTGITINAALGDEGIVEATDKTVLRSDYQVVKNLLETYKLERAVGKTNGAEVTDESLIGVIYKKVTITDTKRDLGVIVDFDALGKEPEYGKGGITLLEQENNDMTAVKEIENIYELTDVYAVDLETGELYYINGTEIYGEEDAKVEVQENEATVTKYDVETFNQAYLERRMFKTTWNVILGEEEGSSTYSTVTLPAYTGAIYDAIIYWGDGTSTTIQHNANDVTLTDAELMASVTHEYIVLDAAEPTREIKISGTYGDFRMDTSTSTPTKLKLVGISQWGNVDFTAVNFSECTNLAGSIPSAKIEGCFSNCITFANLFKSCTSLTGNIPQGLFESAENSTNFSYCFYGCTGLTGEIPDELFANKIKCTSFQRAFDGCTGITGKVPANLFKNCIAAYHMGYLFANTSISEIDGNVFTNVNNGEDNQINDIGNLFENCQNLQTIPEGLLAKCNNIQSIAAIFQGCTNLKTLADDFVIPEGTVNASAMFWKCKSLTSLPENFTVPEGVINVGYMFRECNNLMNIPANFKIPNSVTGPMWCMFYGCSRLESIPDGVIIPEGVDNVVYMFLDCDSLKELPANLTIPNGVKNVGYMFSGCNSLTSLPNNFSVPSSVEKMHWMFNSCTSLTDLPEGVIIPDGVTNVECLFQGCNSLTNLPTNFTIPDSVEGSLAAMFAGCNNLTSLPENFTIPEGVTNVKNMFLSCSNLCALPDNFSLPEGLENAEGMLMHCGKITELPTTFKLPTTVQITKNMFYGCGSLSGLPDNFTIPSKVTDMSGIFRYCPMLKGTIIIETTPTTYDYCFQSTATSSGSTLTVNYTSTCTNVKDIVATGNATYVIEGALVEEISTEDETGTGT